MAKQTLEEWMDQGGKMEKVPTGHTAREPEDIFPNGISWDSAGGFSQADERKEREEGKDRAREKHPR